MDNPPGKMGRLSSEQVLKDNNTRDATSISALKLNHKALIDVSSLVDFKNLQRLDLGFNNLTSLQDLKPCVNLKWLSVVQNKLQSLQGIEGLVKLTVLNAGKNKLKSMDEVQSLANLRALILNDNEIASICKLDEMKELNTLVLSRNPIQQIGKSLIRVKSIAKLSLSNCQLQDIGTSLISCIGLKELRLAHNHIQVLPDELAKNARLRNLDLGNNLITSWSNVKVLKSLINLRNLNLLGNPIAENEKSKKKMRNALPNLQIFNAKPVDKNIKNKRHDDVDAADKLVLNAGDDTDTVEEEQRDVTEEKKAKHHTTDKMGNDGGNSRKEGKQKRQRRVDDLPREVGAVPDSSRDESIEKKENRKSNKAKKSELDVIDDTEAPFMELFEMGSGDHPQDGEEGGTHEKAVQNRPPSGGTVSVPVKRKKSKKRPIDPSQLQSAADEIGMGGLSTWGD